MPKENDNADKFTGLRGSDLLSYSKKVRDSALKKIKGSKKKKKEEVLKAYENQILNRLRERREIEYPNRNEIREDENFYDSCLTEHDNLGRAMPKFRDVKVNTLAKAIDYYSTLVTNKNYQGRIIPNMRSTYDSVDEMSKQQDAIAREYDLRYKSILGQNNWPKLLEEIVNAGCVSGVAYLHHGVRKSRASGMREFFMDVERWENVFTDGLEKPGGMRDANYAFLMKRVRAERLKALYPNLGKDIEEMKTSYTSDTSVTNDDFGSGYDGSYGNAHSQAGLFSTTSHKEHDTEYDNQIIVGQGYFYDTVSNEDSAEVVDACLRTYFMTDPNMTKIKLIVPPAPIYWHNQIPLCQLVYRRNQKTGMPYGPLIRNRRGLERVLTHLLRQMVRSTGGRSVKINYDAMQSALTGDVTPESMIRDIEKRLQQTNAVFFEHGASGSMEIIEHSGEVQAMGELLKIVNEMMKEGIAIHPTLQGEKTSVVSGRAMDQLSQQSEVGVAGLETSLKFDVIKRMGQQLVANIQQFNGAVDYGSIRDQGQDIQLGRGGEETMMGTDPRFDVISTVRGSTYSEDEQLRILQVMEKSTPSIQLPLLLLLVKSMPNAGELLEELKGIMKEFGMPIPQATMTDEEAQELAQSKQQEAQKAEEMRQAEVGKLTGETQATLMRAKASMLQAQQPANLREKELRDQIFRLSQKAIGVDKPEQ